MSNLAVFSFNSQEIRFVDGKPVANDVAMVLGYADPAKTVSTKVSPKNRTVAKTVTVDGKRREVTVLEEAGIYQLIFGSKLPSAEAFQDWVFEEVLPSIRKTGQYAIATHPRLPQRDAIAYIEAAKEVETINNLSLQQLLRDELIDELSAKRGQKQLAGDPVQYTIVKVRARELGYSTADIGNGSALGKFVAKAIAPAFIERVGKYEVKHYQVNDVLDTAIKTYFGMKHSLAS